MRCGSETPPELKQIQRQSRHVQKCLTVVNNLCENVVRRKKTEDEFKVVEILQTIDGIMKEMKQVTLKFLTPQTICYKKLNEDLKFKQIHSNCEELNKRYNRILEDNKELEKVLKIYVKQYESEEHEVTELQNQIEELDKTINNCFKQKEKLFRKNKELSHMLIEMNNHNEEVLKEKNKEIAELQTQLKLKCKN